jgi:hypothetical protein
VRTEDQKAEESFGTQKKKNKKGKKKKEKNTS